MTPECLLMFALGGISGVLVTFGVIACWGNVISGWLMRLADWLDRVAP